MAQKPFHKTSRRHFCARPFDSFITMNFGESKMCCDSQAMGDANNRQFETVWNGPLWKEVRASVLADQRHSACDACWKKEDAGLSSPRETHTRFHSLLETSSQDGTSSVFPKIVSLRLGNLCNLKCVMCAPFNSTKWNEDADIHAAHIKSSQNFIVPPDILDDDIPLESLQHVEHLTFIGGEPFLIKSHLKVLDHILASGRASQVTLKYFSNTTFLPSWCQNYFSQFKRIEFRSSIDGVGSAYNYIRFPAQWTQVEETIHQLNELQLKDFDYGICFVFMSINALQLEELFLWRSRFSWKISPPIIRPDYLVEPSFFQAHTLSDGEKEVVFQSLDRIASNLCIDPMEKTLVSDMKTQMAATHPHASLLRQQRDQYLAALDQKRNTESSNLQSLPMSLT